MNRRTALMTGYPTLRAWQEAKGWTVKQAAKYLGLSTTTYHRLVTRQQFIKGTLAAEISRKTKVPLDVLVGAA